MLGIYILITIFSQLSAGNLWLDAQPPTKIMASVEKLNGLTEGAEVISEGKVVGKVTAITGEDSGRQFEVDLEISSKYSRFLKDGTVALILPKLTSQKELSTSVVKLLVPPTSDLTADTLKDGQSIIGYSSFVEFWSADFSKEGQKSNLFQAS